jgi:predicted Zn-dependent peptidase
MEDSTTIQEIVKRLDRLTPVQQKQILNTVLSFLGEPVRGSSGKEMVKFVGMFPPEDLEQIKQAIEEDCEQVDTSEW